ncbi:anaerobic ribonucleoside-triphosphate reductase activating protein [Spiroplasma diminutum]|uniref:Anaerobic ribonucleoside-triphosphate reductase-activating protein n=1 Tax=Spiroplasma diminutum CUAS-1 TaxID=1276221 RepID=S5MJR2_9MOLU|nr:anaerobic ribonucleoside-triphosphate reductase activating protein [Spiroplasma diminutum]AGR42190.1 anaerobic ribonucleoside-triphosphate reductase activating protein [Spiroplasma diminutum CUAS-1]
MKILKIFKETISDGPGLRYSIYIAGCLHACKGCHNMISWSFKIGKDFNDQYEKEIIDEIKANPLLNGITFSGGDPMFSAIELIPFVKKLKKETGLNIWLYTGFTIEELIDKKNNIDDKQSAMYILLTLVDTLVDGRFVKELYDPNILYRGSSNQRIIDLKQYFNLI